MNPPTTERDPQGELMADDEYCNCMFRVDGNGTERVPSGNCPIHGTN